LLAKGTKGFVKLDSAASEDRRLGEGPVQHFTNAEGVQGITGISLSDWQVGQSLQVPKLSFGQGVNSFLAEETGEIFVTEIGIDATAGQLQQIGVFGDKQQYVIQFSRESAFAHSVRLSPLFPARSIFGIPQGTVLDDAGFAYTVTRLR
jgi:hypothetical protein